MLWGDLFVVISCQHPNHFFLFFQIDVYKRQRVTWIEDRYWITWCNGYHGPTIGIAYTFDFKEFFQCENAFLPFNRNGVLFPQKINGKYAMLSRPSDNGHTPFGDIYISYSPDMKYWGEHRNVMKVTPFPESAWQCTKIGAGSVPFLVDEGWLMFYHGVITTCNGFRYSMGAAILDKDNPDKVLYRTCLLYTSYLQVVSIVLHLTQPGGGVTCIPTVHCSIYIPVSYTHLVLHLWNFSLIIRNY